MDKMLLDEIIFQNTDKKQVKKMAKFVKLSKKRIINKEVEKIMKASEE